jgi:hypothetical protein
MSWQPPRTMTLEKFRTMQKMRESGKSYELIAALNGIGRYTAWAWLTGRRTFDLTRMKNETSD